MGKKPIKTFVWYQLPALLWAVAIFLQSSKPHMYVPDFKFKWSDKFFHMLEFAILTILLFRAFKFSKLKFIQQGKYWLTLLAGSLYGLSDEIHQSFVPGRIADPFDWLADVIGTLLVLYFLRDRKKSAALKNVATSGQEVCREK